jgi:hypothetical protein
MPLIRRFVLLWLVVVCLPPALAAAQGSAASSLSGVAVDPDGAALPGATVVIKHDATGIAMTLVTNESGAFSAPSLEPGVYTVTVTLTGFKTAVVRDVTLVAGSPSNLPKIALALGNLEETVTVKAGTELIQTQSASVSSTINVVQITRLPMVTQNGSAFIANLPGVDTGGNHSVRSSTVNGLPASAINITLDGISDMDMAGKELWSMIHPKLDQVEQVTVTGAVPGADSAGQGAVTVKWVTRAGTNRFDGSAYSYIRHWDFNSNYYFNKVNGLGKNEIKLLQFGAREGGPIIKNKMFFFFNIEEFRRPASATNTRRILDPAAQNGIFRYGTGQSVNLLDLAARNGQTVTTDPLIMSTLGRIRQATTTEGTVSPLTDPNLMQYVYQGEGGRDEHNPTVRIDYNVNNSHRLSGTYNWQRAFQHPDLLNGNDPTFPGFANFLDQQSTRTLGSMTLRSTLTPRLVNELIGGYLWSPIDFSGPLSPAQFEDQGGFNLSFPYTLTSATISTGISARNNSHWDINDNLSYLAGNHSISFGFGFTRSNTWSENQTAVPQITFGVDTNDPATAMFTAANFPGASATDLTNARSLYGLLTGRVTAVNGNIRLSPDGKYTYMGLGRQEGQLDEYGTFAQDSWRITPTLTTTLGLRWQVQMPFRPSNSLYSRASLAAVCGVSGVDPEGLCNQFAPGQTPGTVTTYDQYEAGQQGYNTDWNNLAPSVGVAWRPNVQTGLLRTILGDPEQATIRAGYAIAYNRESNSVFTGPFSNNPGLTITQNRNAATGLLVRPGEQWPVLLRETDRLGPPPFCSATVTTLCMPASPSYPMAASLSNSVNAFDPDWQVAHTNSWSVGLQRALGADTAVEVRYVATRNRDGNITLNLNEVIVEENGFAKEFRLAQANLRANIASGRGATFAYFGAGTGTAPLPIYLANFTGKPASAAGDPSQYTGANWTNSTQVAQVGQILPGTPISTAAASLQGNATFRASMLAAGLPTNFWVMNPDVSAANLTRSIAQTKYDALQIELRRRLSGGVSVSGNYTYAARFTSVNDTLRRPLRLVEDNAGVKHALKANWTWDIPIGRGRALGTDMNRWLDGVVGGWDFDGILRVQSGSQLDFGNVQLVGMTLDELRHEYKVQFRNSPQGVPTVYMLPQDIIDNTIRAFNVSATSATGYAGPPPTGRYIAPANNPACVQIVRGDCAPANTFVYGPTFARVDFSFRKTFPLGGSRNVQFEFDLLNAFNAIGFNAVAQASAAATINQVTSAYTDINNTFDPGGRLGQLMFRINW